MPREGGHRRCPTPRCTGTGAATNAPHRAPRARRNWCLVNLCRTDGGALGTVRAPVLPGSSGCDDACMRSADRLWQTVPMPPVVAALPRDVRGFPILWAALWESGREERVAWPSVGQVREVGCSCWPGRGRPILGQLCVVRQRICMKRRRCQLCGQAIPGDQPAVFVAGRPDGPAQPVSEPPLHYDCAAYALRVCPHLVTGVTGHRAGQVCVAEADDYALLEEHVAPGPDRRSLITSIRRPGEHPAPTDAPSALQTYLALPATPWIRADRWLETRN